MRHMIPLLLATFAAVASTLNAAGQDQPSLWTRYTHQLLADESQATVDPEGMRATQLGHRHLGRWALNQLSRIADMSEDELHVWLRVVREYRIREAEGALLELAERLIQRPSDQDAVRIGVFTALAAVAGPGSEDRVGRLMRAEINEAEFHRQNAEEFTRAGFAAALVLLDDDAGRDYLITAYREHLILMLTTSPYPQVAARVTLQAMHDAELIERVEALAGDPQLQNRKQQNNIRTVADALRFNGAVLEEIRAAVDQTDHEHMNRRISAMRALSERGTREDISRLANLRGWTNASDLVPGHVHHDILEAERFKCMTLLACRLWRER